ncbi:hypothetical protein LAV35_10495 [Clostridium sporogenes]|uniref:hypothetical protein n=1 Tax=Clostridium sporogenes TaxID=1509 RepID=UPI0022379D79|nr:hypothetical protein [Clostridium sporogenes]MCW6060866.1 hypothetical protein [Clostridium sporogenes]MCW6068613.1 hypothetical protein [Clostridium sporogenes]
MLYAKCIRESQIADNREQFILRQNEENHVYCVGETTKLKDGMGSLYCVPLNFIYDCLKYGRYIAIIDIHIDDKETYVKRSSYMGLEKTCKEQHVIKIMDSYSKEAIDFVFNEVKNPELVHDGYIHFLPQNSKDYFKKLKEQH